MEKYFTCKEVATRYGVKLKTVWVWLREKKLGALKIGKEYRIRESDLAEFEKKNETF